MPTKRRMVFDGSLGRIRPVTGTKGTEPALGEATARPHLETPPLGLPLPRQHPGPVLQLWRHAWLVKLFSAGCANFSARTARRDRGSVAVRTARRLCDDGRLGGECGADALFFGPVDACTHPESHEPVGEAGGKAVQGLRALVQLVIVTSVREDAEFREI